MAVATITINTMNLDPVVELSKLFVEVLQDERIPLSIRAEYLDKIVAIETKAEKMATEEQAYGNDCPNGKCDV